MTAEELKQLDERIAKKRGWEWQDSGDRWGWHRGVLPDAIQVSDTCPSYPTDPAWSYELERAIVKAGYEVCAHSREGKSTVFIFKNRYSSEPPLAAEAEAKSRLVALAIAADQLPEGALK